VLAGLALLAPSRATAHCDTLDGPVVADARAALEAGDVTPSLKWVGEAGEPEVREAFRRALAVRGLGPDARALADRSFFETIVRVHRNGEGAPYTGLQPASSAVDPAVAAADAALNTRDEEELARSVSAMARQGLQVRLARAAEARRHADESVEKGRSYVAAYVDLVHYAERLFEAAAAPPSHDRGGDPGAGSQLPARAPAQGHAH
jgi:hypothetical protein